MADTLTASVSKTTNVINSPRAVELLVFPVSEKSGWLDDSRAVRIYSDGSRDTIGMTCSIEKSIMGVPSSSTVVIYNLSSETRNALNSPSLKAVIRVSDPYSNGKMQEIYSGGILACTSQRQGADIVTTLFILVKCADLMSSAITKSWAGYAKLADVLSDLASELGVSNVVVNGISEDRKLYSGGFSFAGQPIDILNKLAFQEGFCWSLDNDELVIIGDDYVSTRTIFITHNDYLIQATPLLTGAYKTQNGVIVKAYLIPWISVGDTLSVSSIINPICNQNNLRVHVIKMNLSTISNQWEMELTCYIPVTRALWNI